jgi:hypothetical protein
LACLLLALFPYYSHTAGPAAQSGLPTTIELPPLGSLPLDPSKTVFRLGLPFSPLLTYHKEITFEGQPPSAPGPATGGDIQPGDAFPVDEVKINFSGNIGYTYNWRFGFFSWSLALALLGVGLLIVAFSKRRTRSRARPDMASEPSG